VNFLQFLATLKVTPTEAQELVCRVAFDHEPIPENELAREVFGAAREVPPDARKVIAILAGARSGKTYLAALRLLHLALYAPLVGLAPGELAAGLIVAPDLRLARQCLRYASGAVESHPALKKRVQTSGADGFTLKRSDGHMVSIECIAATRGGSALRGRSLFGAVLDEACFFRSGDSYEINCGEIYRAVAPRVMTGGQLIVASTPFVASGVLIELYEANHGAPRAALNGCGTHRTRRENSTQCRSAAARLASLTRRQSRWRSTTTDRWCCRPGHRHSRAWISP